MSSDQPHDIDISDSVDIFDLVYPGAKRHVHKPLQRPDSIRVLELLPGNSGSALSCRIHEIHRTNADVDFEAISYVWGSPIPACYLHEVESNSMLSITESLYLALRALRYPDRSRIIWADAVCINQSDNDEKSDQVRSMGSLYAAASIVVVWLGNEDLRGVFQHLLRYEKASKHWTGKLTETLQMNTAAILRVVGKEWFTRVWIIQEFVLARDVQIVAGNHSINYRTLERAMASCEGQGLLFRLNVLKDQPPEGWPLVLAGSLDNYALAENLFKLRNRWRDQSRWGLQRMSLYYFCRTVHDHPPKCTDKRDLIYALLGLAKEPVKIVPNYSLSVTNVLLEFTWSELMNGNISILRDAVFLRKGDLFPSFLYRPDRNFQTKVKNFWPLKVADANRAVCVQVINPASIQIRGVMVDRISEFWRITPARVRRPESSTGVGQNSFHGHLAAENYFEDPTSVPWDPGVETLDSIESTTLLRVYRSLQTHASRLIDRGLAPRDVTGETLRDQLWRALIHSDYLVPSDTPKDLGQASRSHIYDSGLAKFFITSKGYGGRAAGQARVGDSVVMFDGSKVPFVIREAGDGGSIRWKLVGECHVDGWIDGSYCDHEVLDDVDQYLAAADAESNTGFSFRKKILLSEYFVLC